MRLLISHGADTTVADGLGETALMLAAREVRPA
jgi:ankyrin repeat protein